MASARVAGRTPTAVIASVLTTALQFSEGPVWLGAEQAIGHGFGRGAGLLFSDIDASKQYMLCDGRLRVVRSNSNGANGNAISADGALLSCEHQSRRIVRIDPMRKPVTLVERFEGARLNSPNDLCVIGSDAIVFTDPPYGVEEKDRELMFSGVYRLNADSSLDLLDDRLIKPNGVAVGPDGCSVWVSDTETGHVWRYELSSGGSVLGRERIVKFSRPDGLVFDSAGHLLAATTDGISVLDIMTGKIDHIACPQRPANLCFGGRDGDELLVCARSDIYVLNWHSPGLDLLNSPPTSNPEV